MSYRPDFGLDYHLDSLFFPFKATSKPIYIIAIKFLKAEYVIHAAEQTSPPRMLAQLISSTHTLAFFPVLSFCTDRR